MSLAPPGRTHALAPNRHAHSPLLSARLPAAHAGGTACLPVCAGRSRRSEASLTWSAPFRSCRSCWLRDAAATTRSPRHGGTLRGAAAWLYDARHMAACMNGMLPVVPHGMLCVVIAGEARHERRLTAGQWTRYDEGEFDCVLLPTAGSSRWCGECTCSESTTSSRTGFRYAPPPGPTVGLPPAASAREKACAQ